MAIVQVAFTTVSPGGNAETAATSPIDTTGADLLLVWVTTSINWGTLTDSKNNLWMELTRRNVGNTTGRFLYCTGPVVGSGHTFRLTEGLYTTVTVYAFSGVKNFQAEVGAISSGSVTSLSSGSLTPSVAGSLVVTGFVRAGMPPGLVVAPAGFEATKQTLEGNTDAATAWLEQGTAAAINATWSWTGALISSLADMVVFNPGDPIAAGRISQIAIEIMAAGDPPQARVSQVVVEGLIAPPPPIARISQANIEMLVLPPSTLPAKVSQVAVEMLVKVTPPSGAGNAVWIGDSGGTIWVE